jgi:hypothetical protein
MIWRRLGAKDGNCAHESTAGNGAKSEEISRRCAPRNDKKALVGMTSRGAPRNAPFPAFIPNPASGGVRNPQLRNAFGMDDLDDLEAAGGGGRKLRARIYSGKRCKIRGDFSSLRSSE